MCPLNITWLQQLKCVTKSKNFVILIASNEWKIMITIEKV